MSDKISEPELKQQIMRCAPCRRFSVWGHAFLPVMVRIEVNAPDADAAMEAANQKLKTGIQHHIVSGTEDVAAAWGFDACNAEELQ